MNDEMKNIKKKRIYKVKGMQTAKKRRRERKAENLKRKDG